LLAADTFIAVIVDCMLECFRSEEVAHQSIKEKKSEKIKMESIQQPLNKGREQQGGFDEDTRQKIQANLEEIDAKRQQQQQ
jgi:hypothetical protein